jgi:hypothetical protein
MENVRWRKSQSIVQPDFCRNQGLISRVAEKPQKEHGNRERQERLANQGSGVRQSSQKTSDGIGNNLHLSADGTGLAGVVVIGVQKDKDFTCQKSREDT